MNSVAVAMALVCIGAWVLLAVEMRRAKLEMRAERSERRRVPLVLLPVLPHKIERE